LSEFNLPGPIIADMKKTANTQLLDRAYDTLLSEVMSLVDAPLRMRVNNVNLHGRNCSS
jgi:hypothetical protein